MAGRAYTWDEVKRLMWRARLSATEEALELVNIAACKEQAMTQLGLMINHINLTAPPPTGTLARPKETDSP